MRTSNRRRSWLRFTSKSQRRASTSGPSCSPSVARISQRAVSWEPRRGATMAIADPSGRQPPSRLVPPWWWARGHAPLLQYSSRLLGARRAHGCPQRARIMDPRAVLPCKSTVSWESGTGGQDAVHGPPPVRAPLVGDLDSRRRDGGEGYAPVVAVLLGSTKAAERISVPKGRSRLGIGMETRNGFTSDEEGLRVAGLSTGVGTRVGPGRGRNGLSRT
jgi:hypothetical protein